MADSLNQALLVADKVLPHFPVFKTRAKRLIHDSVSVLCCFSKQSNDYTIPRLLIFKSDYNTKARINIQSARLTNCKTLLGNRQDICVHAFMIFQ